MNIDSISPLSSPNGGIAKTDTSEISKARNTFADVISSTINEVEKQHNEGEKEIQALHTGQAKNLHEVVLAVEEADISMRMLVQFRNKALQAYEEIMRMQI